MSHLHPIDMFGKFWFCTSLMSHLRPIDILRKFRFRASWMSHLHPIDILRKFWFCASWIGPVAVLFVVVWSWQGGRGAVAHKAGTELSSVLLWYGVSSLNLIDFLSELNCSFPFFRGRYLCLRGSLGRSWGGPGGP